jgi:hypothetical protein
VSMRNDFRNTGLPEEQKIGHLSNMEMQQLSDAAAGLLDYTDRN